MSFFSILSITQEYGDQETIVCLSKDKSSYITTHPRSKEVIWRAMLSQMPSLRRLAVASSPDSCCFWEVQSHCSGASGCETFLAILRSKAGELELHAASGEHFQVKVSKHIFELLPFPLGLLLRAQPSTGSSSTNPITLYSMDGPYSAVRAVDTSSLINQSLPPASILHVHNDLAVFRYGQSGHFALCRIEKKAIIESTVAHQFNASAEMNTSSLIEKSMMSSGGEHSSRSLEQFISINSGGGGSLSRSGSTSRMVNVVRGRSNSRTSPSPSAMRATSPLVQAELAASAAPVATTGAGYSSDALQSFLGVKPTMHYRDIAGVDTTSRNASMLLHRANSPKMIDTNNLMLFHDHDAEDDASNVFESEYFTANDPYLVVVLLSKFEVAECDGRDITVFFAADSNRTDNLSLNITDSTSFLNQYKVITNGDDGSSYSVELVTTLELTSESPVQFASVLYQDSSADNNNCKRVMSVLLTLVDNQLMIGIPGSSTFIPLPVTQEESNDDNDWINSLLSTRSKMQGKMRLSRLKHMSALSEYFAVVNEVSSHPYSSFAFTYLQYDFLGNRHSHTTNAHSFTINRSKC